MSDTIITCRYVCNSCGADRVINIDKATHVNRRDLKREGLASYIDVHEIKGGNEEHGMRVFLDHDFVVRANSEISLKLSKTKFSTLPTPVVKPSVITFTTTLQGTLSVSLTSSLHNLNIIVKNSENSFTDVKTLSLKSEFETVDLVVKYSSEILNEESVVNFIEWGKVLLKWIEFTARLQSSFLPGLVKLIEKNFIRPPTVTDELYLSILLDAHALIQIHDQNVDLKSILYNSVITLPGFDEDKAFKDITGVSLDVLELVGKTLRAGNKVEITSLIDLISEQKNDTHEALESLVILLVELIRLDIVSYQVSYLQ